MIRLAAMRRLQNLRAQRSQLVLRHGRARRLRRGLLLGCFRVRGLLRSRPTLRLWGRGLRGHSLGRRRTLHHAV